MSGDVAVMALAVAIVAFVLSVWLTVVLMRDRQTSGMDGRAAGPHWRAEPGRRPLVTQVSPIAGGLADPATPASSVGLDRLGLVRFDAYEDTGGGQSFALALLDEVGDGVVLTSLHSRQATRLYVKRITRGTSEAALSREEVAALRDAASRGQAM